MDEPTKDQLRQRLESLRSEHRDLESFGPKEGGKKQRFSSYYERNPFYREKAIEVHGVKCMACGFDFERIYGKHGKGYVHVHHNKPISETGPTRIDPGSALMNNFGNSLPAIQLP